MLDSIRLSFQQKARFVLAFDSRNSFISDKRAEILGLKLGVVFGEKFGMGICGHLLNQNNSHFYKEYAVVSDAHLDQTIQAHLQLYYFAYYVEYIFHNSKHWKFSIPLQLGAGESNYLYSYNGKEELKDRHLIITYEPIVASEYKLLNWLSVTGEIGYRIMLVNNPAVKENFNSPTFSAGISIAYIRLYKLFFPDSRATKWLNGVN